MYTVHLLVSAAVLGAISYAMLRLYFSARLAATVSAIKFGLPVLYFQFAPYLGFVTSKNGPDELFLPFSISDGVTYYRWGNHVLQSGYGPITTITTTGGRRLITEPATRSHIFYDWWNVLAQSIIGPYYYSPVLLNVFVTVLTGIYLMKLFGGIGFNQEYYHWFGVFFLLHWDVLAWSSFLNLKGIISLFGIVMFLYHFVQFHSSVRESNIGFLHVGMICFAVMLLYFTRYYIAVLLAGAVLVWAVIHSGETENQLMLMFGVVVVGFVGITGYLPINRIASNVSSHVDVLAIQYGLVDFLLSPRPWGIESNWMHLQIPTILHWLLFGATIGGSLRLALKNQYLELFVLFAVLVTLLYSTTPTFQGPRQRYQLAFVIAMAQFEVLWLLTRNVSFRSSFRRLDKKLASDGSP